MSSIAALAVAASVALGQTDASPSNYEHLKQYGEAFAGVWVGEWEWDFDIPGVVNKGDKVTVRSTTKWILNKNALETSWEADINGKPAGSGKGIAGWDRSTKEIVSFGFGSFGGRGQAVLTLLGDRWLETRIGVGVEGNKNASTNIITFSDSGETQNIELTGRVSPKGDALPNITITYKRAKATE